MNGQLPPTDPVLRKHLARRSSGPIPKGLLAGTYARLDAAPQRARRSAPRALRMPRLALAGAGMAVALLLAVAVALPALHPAPAGFIAGYPAQRALTTAELAELMSGPELPQNTPIVAEVTIQSRSDICPMNRYPTVGVIEGMESQVCVMGYDLSSRPSGERTSGTFAFRYIAPGYLGLLTAITSAQSRLAYSVAQDWPLAGLPFLVEGYLGSAEVPCAAETEAPGDVLSPSGYEQCRWSWLSDDTSPVAVRSVPTWSPAAQPSSGPSIDWLALDGKARHVEAGGARLIDSIPDATTHGVFVVKAVTAGCPGAAPFSSVGCSMWRVLAKVPELSLPGPDYTPTPTPSPSPPAAVGPDGLLGPGNEPLALAEVVDLMQADPDHLAGWTVVMDAPFGSGVSCPDEPASPCGALKDLRESQGTWAVRIQSDGMFGIMGEVHKSASGKLVSPLSEAASDAQPYLRVVDAWLHADTVLPCATAEPTPGTMDCRPVETAWLTPDGTDLSATRANVQTGAYTAFIGGTDRRPVHGIYLLSPSLLLSRFAPEGWKPGPSVSPPASPVPQSLSYPAQRALVPDEVHRVLLSPGLAAGTTLVANLTIQVRHEGCAIDGYLQTGVTTIGAWSYCVVVAGESDYLQKDVGWGLFAFKYLAPNYLLLLGPVTPASSTGRIAFEPDAVWPAEGVILVEGRMTRYASAACPVLGAGCNYSILQKSGASPAPSPWPYGTGSVPGLGRMVTSVDLERGAESGVFVLTKAPSCWQSVACAEWSALARVDESVAAALPDPTPYPTQTPRVGGGLLGLLGEGNRPLTQAEFSSAWKWDPQHLANRVAVVKGPVPAGFICWNEGASDPSAPPGLCQLGVEPSQIAPEGYWAVKVGRDGKMQILGELKMTGSLFVWSVDQVLADESLKADDFLLVQAALRPEKGKACPTSPGSSICMTSPAMLSTVPGSSASLSAQAPAYWLITGDTRGVSGLVLIQRGSDKPTILAVFDLVFTD